MKTFTYDIAIKSIGSTKDDVKVVQFGNGYQQRQPKGLAPRLENWQVSKIGTKAKIDEIKTFLDEHSVKPFLWRVTSDEPLKKYVAKGISRSPQGGRKWSLSWTMEQVLA